MNGHQRHTLRRVRQVVVLISQQTHLTQEIRDRRIVDAFVGALIDELMDRRQ